MTDLTERERLARDLCEAEDTASYQARPLWEFATDDEKDEYRRRAGRLLAAGLSYRADVVEECAKISDQYGDWTYWGQYDNWSAALSAAREITVALFLGRPLTQEDVKFIDKIKGDEPKAIAAALRSLKATKP